MAGKNIAQKILARAAGKEAAATGEYLIVRSKLPVTSEGDYLSRGPDSGDRIRGKEGL